MNCKDCLHFEVCASISKRQSLATLYYAEECPCFKDNSEWVHLPCEVGDTIYFDTYRRGENIGVQPHKVAKVGVIVSTERQFGSVGTEIPDWQFGKTVFLTREEAEKALAERRKH